MLGRLPERIHQAHRTGFLAAQREGGMNMKNAGRHPRLIAQPGAEGKNGAHRGQPELFEVEQPMKAMF
jgi:hypothetical protein